MATEANATATEANAVAETSAQSITALYIGDLDGSVTDEELHRLFSQTGDVTSVKICVDQTTERSLGYGYVNYSNPQDGTYFPSSEYITRVIDNLFVFAVDC